MKKTVLIRLILLYVIFVVFLTLMFSLGYYFFIDGGDCDIFSCILFSLAISVGHNINEVIVINRVIDVFIILQKFIVGLSLPIFTSFIFYYIVNIRPDVVFPRKLLIRKNSNGEIVLTILLGNKDYQNNKFYLYDVSCKLIYSYAVDREHNYRRNAKTQLESFASTVIGFYRFSFPLSKFPRHFVDSILSKDPVCLSDTLIFTISGKIGPWRSSFIVNKTFRLSEVFIASDNKEIYEEKLVNNKIKEIFMWDNMNRLISYTEDKEKEVIDDINRLEYEK